MSIDSVPISNFMTKKAITATEDQNIHSASRKMYENNIGSVIVVNNGTDNKPVGIITERDVVRVLGHLQPWLLNSLLRELMSKPLITVSSNSSLRDGIQTMYTKNIRRLPVVSDMEPKNHILGIITDKDIFRVLLKNQNLVQSLVSDELMAQYGQTVHKQFAEYWFNDILVHKK